MSTAARRRSCDERVSLNAPPTVIPFNADGVTVAQVRRTDGIVSYRLPCATVTPGKALRLNSGGLEFGEPPPLRDMPAIDDQLAFLGRHFQHECGIWAKYSRLFIERYFDFIAREVSAHRAELTDRLARYGTLYDVDHWSFSALRPLPRAHLAAPEGPEDSPPESLVPASIAFWTADGAVAVDLIGGATRGQREAVRRARLDAAGIRVIEMPHEILTRGDIDAFAARMPDDFHTFWRGEALPSGPFRADAGPLALPD